VKPRHLLMAVGVAIAAWLALFGDKTPSGNLAEPVARTAAKPVAPREAVAPPIVAAAAPEESARKSKSKPEPTILALRARAELIGGAGSADKIATLFGTQSWTPPPPPPAKPSAPPPPTAPALPYTYIGKKLEDDAWEVYLTKGEHTFIVHDKTTIEETYRVESIKPPTLTLTYLPLNQMQTLPIGGAD
jgi:predicted RNA binding protein YcfA (HicA-like mRNA interferase family)